MLNVVSFSSTRSFKTSFKNNVTADLWQITMSCTHWQMKLLNTQTAISLDDKILSTLYLPQITLTLFEINISIKRVLIFPTYFRRAD